MGYDEHGSGVTDNEITISGPPHRPAFLWVDMKQLGREGWGVIDGPGMLRSLDPGFGASLGADDMPAFQEV
mgnify:CR=1 FL=1